MSYEIIWDDGAVKDLLKLQKNDAKKIKKKIDTFLCLDPVNLGNKLSANLAGYYRYRFGDYRIIYEVLQTQIIIVKIGHRKNIYD